MRRPGLGLLAKMLLAFASVFLPLTLLSMWALLERSRDAGTILAGSAAASFVAALLASWLAYRIWLAPPMARLRAVLDSVGEGIVTAGASGRIRALNRAAEAMFGPAGDLIGRPLAALLADPAADVSASGAPRRLDGRRADGGVVALDITVAAVPEAHETLLCARAVVERGDGAKADFPAAATIANVGRSSAVAVPPLAAEPVGPGLRVLVAEDNRTNQVLIRAMLARLGHHADLTDNGLEAVAAIARRPYDMVLMDVMMPELDGLEATRRIRALAGPSAAVPIFGLTAHAASAEHAACREAGMDRVITKPVTIGGLADAIGAVATRLAAS